MLKATPEFPNLYGWLGIGEEMPPREEVWCPYLRRFTIDHWYRFFKQRLYWAYPNLSTANQCVRSACLKGIMLIMDGC